MKKVLIFIIAILPLFAIAQNETTPEIDERLYDVFEAEFLERMQKENPEFIQYQNFYLDNSYEIIPFPKGKTSQYSIIEIDDLENLNIIELKNKVVFETNPDYTNFYIIKGEDKILMIFSEKALLKKFEAYLKQTK